MTKLLTIAQIEALLYPPNPPEASIHGMFTCARAIIDLEEAAPYIAATAIDALTKLAAAEARETNLRDALRPFAARAQAYDPVENDDHHFDWSRDGGQIKLGQLRQARAALDVDQ